MAYQHQCARTAHAAQHSTQHRQQRHRHMQPAAAHALRADLLGSAGGCAQSSCPLPHATQLAAQAQRSLHTGRRCAVPGCWAGCSADSTSLSGSRHCVKRQGKLVVPLRQVCVLASYCTSAPPASCCALCAGSCCRAAGSCRLLLVGRVDELHSTQPCPGGQQMESDCSAAQVRQPTSGQAPMAASLPGATLSQPGR